MRAVAWAGFALLFASASARAADVPAAEAAYNAGKALAEAGNWAEACPKYLASYELDPQIGALAHLADCYEHVGKIASAWARWKDCLELADKVGDEDRSALAKERVPALEPRLPHLRLDVAHAEVGLSVQRDDVPVPPATYGLPLPVDPGPIAVRVLRGADVLEERKVEAQEAREAVVALDFAAIDAAHPKAPPPPPPPPLPPPPPPPLPPVKPYDPTQRYAGIGVGSAGLLAVVIAGGLEIGALVERGRARDPSACVDGFCTTAGLDAAHGASTLAQAGQWLGIAGLVTLGAGVAVFFTAPAPPKREPPPVALAPWSDTHGGGAAFVGRW